MNFFEARSPVKLFARPEWTERRSGFPCSISPIRWSTSICIFPPWLPTWSRIFAENLGKIGDGFIDRRFGRRRREENSVREKCKLRAMSCLFCSSVREFVSSSKVLWEKSLEIWNRIDRRIFKWNIIVLLSICQVAYRKERKRNGRNFTFTRLENFFQRSDDRQEWIFL